MCEPKQASKNILMFYIIYVSVWGMGLMFTGVWYMSQESQPEFVRVNLADRGIIFVLEGLAATLMSGVGIYAIFYENANFILMFLMLIFLLMVVTIGHASYYVGSLSTAEATITAGLQILMVENPTQFQKVQKSYKCCGAKDSSDYNPSSPYDHLDWTCCSFAFFICRPINTYDFGCGFRISRIKKSQMRMAAASLTVPIILTLYSLPFFIYLYFLSIKCNTKDPDCVCP